MTAQLMYQITADYGHGFEVYGGGKYQMSGGFVTELRPVVGDHVELDSASRICKLGERTNAISRIKGGEAQTLAVNISKAWLIEPLDRKPSPNRWERFIAFAHDQGLVVDVIFTKSDLCTDPKPWLDLIQEKNIASKVFIVSSKTGQGLEELKGELSETILLLGISGVGKSSLVNGLTGSNLNEGEVRAKDHKGKHMTVVRRLIPWGDSALVDIPGLRELNWEGQGASLNEFTDEFGKCKFSNCTHQTEPGCAVLKALKKGKLDPESYANMLKISMEEVRFYDKKGYEKREQRQENKRFSKHIRQTLKQKHR